MPTISNKTHAPLRVPLPGGKTLHLGPGKTGQVSPKAVDHPGLKKLVDAGQIEITDENQSRTSSTGGAHQTKAASPGHHAKGGARNTGDR